jgi:hypothetical protein
MSDLNKGLALWQEISEFLNQQILAHGEIQINNRKIWDGYLHQWDNSDWVCLMEAMITLYDTHPEFYKKPDIEIMKDTARVLAKGIEQGKSRVMDQHHKISGNKAKAWRTIMTAREVWNRANDVWLPNSDLSQVTKFEEIFD